jgi:hypothetical protein
MNENEVDECIIRERQKRQFRARNRVALHRPAYERMRRREHGEMDESDHT